MHAHTRFLRYGTLFSIVKTLEAVALLVVAACRGRAGGASTAAPELPPPATEDASVAPPPPRAAAPLVPATAMPPDPPARVPGAAFPAFKKTTLPLDQVATMVGAAPELARVGGSVALFDPGDSPYLHRSKANREGYTITPLPVLWSPEEGLQVLVVVGRGKDASFVAAWWPLAEGQYRLASAFVLLGEVAPVALAFRAPERTLQWTTCWRCSGETGHLALRKDGSVVILQD